MKKSIVTIIAKPYHCPALVSLLCLCLLCWSCVREEDDPEISPVRTVLFYMGGDNNLSGEVLKKADRLKDVAVPPCVHLLVYVDSRDGSPQLLEAGNGKLSLVRDYAESNSADADVFATVLHEVVERYPAPSYGLVVFSHASGWMPAGSYRNTALRSVIIDNDSEMEIPAFAAAIPTGMFDFIAFEACFMAGIEVAYELKDKTNHIVASSAEIVSPGFAPAYSEALPLLFKPEADLPGFCREIAASCRTRPDDYGSLTLSLIQTKGLGAIADIVKGTPPPSDSENVQGFDRYGEKLFFDFFACYSQLLPDRARELQAAIEACVIWKQATDEFMPGYGGFPIREHSGLTCYVTQERYNKLNEAYKGLKWYREVLQ